MQTYEQSGYLAERVLTASPMELVGLLYDGACGAVDLAITMLRANDILARGRAITKAMAIVDELRATLRGGAYPEYASTMMRLYSYVQDRLLQAHTHKSEQALLEASRVLKQLSANWAEVMKQLSSKSSDESPDSVPNDSELWAAAANAANPYSAVFAPAAQSRSWQV